MDLLCNIVIEKQEYAIDFSKINSILLFCRRYEDMDLAFKLKMIDDCVKKKANNDLV